MTKLPSLRPEVTRDGYGRYKLPAENGRPQAWSRATTVVGTLKDLNPLMGWKQKVAVLGAKTRTDLVDRVQILHADIEMIGDWRQSREQRDALKATLDELAAAGGATKGADAGTELHTLSEWSDAGRLDEVAHLATDEQLRDLAAYVTTMDESGIERPAEYIERVVTNHLVEAAGTFDRLLRLPDGRLVVGDLKSQKDFDFGFLEIAAQLATYAYAERIFDVEAGTYSPMPAEVDKTIGVVMHLPVGKGVCELYEVDLEAGWEAALTAHAVRQLRKRGKQMGRRVETTGAASSTTSGGGDQLLFLIRHAPSVESLEGLWRNRRPGEWSQHHIEQAGSRRAALTAAVPG